MSTLPPMPPGWHAKADQNYAAALEILDAMVRGARTDPKRNPEDNADYHNTQVVMLHQWEKAMDDPDATGTRTALAAAVIALDALGWNRAGVNAAPARARRRRWDWRTVGVWAAMIYAAAVSVVAAIRIDQLN